MNHCLRLLMKLCTIEKMTGETDVDETGIGGHVKNMHKGRCAKVITGTGNANKVVGAFARREP